MLFSEYEELFDEATTRFAPPEVESDRWLDAGNAVAGLGDECRVTLLLTGIDPSSLACIDVE